MCMCMRMCICMCMVSTGSPHPPHRGGRPLCRGEQTPRVVTKDPPLAPPRWGGNDPSIVAAHGVVIHGRGVVKLRGLRVDAR